MHEVNEGDFLVRRVVASVFLIFFGFAGAACGNEEAEGAVSGDYAKTGGLSTDDFPVDNQAPEGAQADGRVLKPEGHKGVWFETEPENPWEHYVWESQKFVGDPLELPKLKGGGVKNRFAGLPNVCDRKVVDRLDELGFDVLQPVKNPFIYSCIFSQKDGVRGAFTEEIFEIAILPSDLGGGSRKELEYETYREDILPFGSTGDSNYAECAIVKEADNANLRVEILPDGDRRDVKESCMLSEYLFQMVDNIVNF